MNVRKFSAALASIALSLVGVVAIVSPANATVFPATASPNTFAASQATSAFSVTIPATGVTRSLSELNMVIENTATSAGWNIAYQGCSMGSTNPISTCGVTGLTVGSTTYDTTSSSAASGIIGGKQGGTYLMLKRPYDGQTQQFIPVGPTDAITITFAAGVFTAPADASGTYAFTLYLGADQASAPITVTANSQTVTFDANGGSGTMAAQTGSSSTALTTNSFTRSGYTFGGWATSDTSTTVAYADGAPYPFTSSTTLYAIWTANGGGGGSQGSSASITLNLAVGQPVAGAPVNLNVSGMQPNAAWDATVRSTPISIGSGTVNSSGTLSQTVNLPSSLGAGWHSITFTSTDAAGNPFSSVSYFQVSESGTLLATSQTLATTGADMAVPIGAAAMLLLIGCAILVLRRKTA